MYYFLSLNVPNQTLLYQIAFTIVPGIGDRVGKKLISYCGSVEAVFKEKKDALLRIPGIGKATANSIINHTSFERAEQEINFIIKNKIKPLFYTDSEYPQRLLNCEDGPLMLYYKGKANLNKKRIISFVGTRRATTEGQMNCDRFIEGMVKKDVLIVSGLAYGIDSFAHKKAISEGIETVGVLGHGLDRIYPSQNKKLAANMIEQGGLLTEFKSGTKPDRENFPQRNRIVAGISDAVVVVESAASGGALITADIANSYNRDVFAIPGRLTDVYSEGCNRLIKINKAALAESPKDIAYIMGWDDSKSNVKSQRELFITLSPEQKQVLHIIEKNKKISIDNIAMLSKLSTSKVASALLTLEFEGLIQGLPGKLYKAY